MKCFMCGGELVLIFYQKKGAKNTFSKEKAIFKCSKCGHKEVF